MTITEAVVVSVVSLSASWALAKAATIERVPVLFVFLGGIATVIFNLAVLGILTGASVRGLIHALIVGVTGGGIAHVAMNGKGKK